MLEITGYLLQGVNHLCHSDETNHIICRGGRDYQLEIWHRLSIIKEPTDVALHEAMIESGTNPGRHIKGGAIMKEYSRIVRDRQRAAAAPDSDDVRRRWQLRRRFERLRLADELHALAEKAGQAAATALEAAIPIIERLSEER